MMGMDVPYPRRRAASVDFPASVFRLTSTSRCLRPKSILGNAWIRAIRTKSVKSRLKLPARFREPS